ncbi:MAG: iron-containing alcohol dehydrogenase [Candidatus Thermoplasmatota archaeon]
MLDFTYNIPTKILFGRNKIERLAEEIKRYSQRILFVYGSGSIKRNGIYDAVVGQLIKNDISFFELSGIKPNPSIQSVRDGIELVRLHNIDFILAVGGGSTIDCAKAIAAGFYCDQDPWYYFTGNESKIKKALPIGTVLTLAGTGSEMNGNAVITNEQTQEKLAIHTDLIRPKFSILDPTYTFTVSKEHTAAGIIDIFSHVLEQYFSLVPETYIQDRFAESILKACIHYGPIAMNEPRNYDARANLMWASSLALNGILAYGKTGDWATHAMEHALSAMYDVTHGVGLAILTPAWMSYVLDDTTLPKFGTYALNVWGFHGKDQKKIAKQSINQTRIFFESFGLPKKLCELGVPKESLRDMAQKSCVFGDIGKFKKLNTTDVFKILTAAYE